MTIKKPTVSSSSSFSHCLSLSLSLPVVFMQKSVRRQGCCQWHGTLARVAQNSKFNFGAKIRKRDGRTDSFLVSSHSNLEDVISRVGERAIGQCMPAGRPARSEEDRRRTEGTSIDDVRTGQKGRQGVKIFRMNGKNNLQTERGVSKTLKKMWTSSVWTMEAPRTRTDGRLPKGDTI